MHRALELAELGLGNVSPNPMVGCVIVHNGRIIGEGYHQKYGSHHAEVNAINSVRERDKLAESTLFVTLEPCAHHGKTPPCADLIVEVGIKKVVIATKDPFDQVNGSGMDKLKSAGCDVSVGLMEEEARRLNKRFLTFHEKKRPFIVLKWAQTSDGFLARPGGDSKWISNPYSRQLVHKWRSEEDAILVGKNTALIDNPTLTTRDWVGKNPTRVLLDRELEVSKDSNIYNVEAPTLIFNSKKDGAENEIEFIKVNDLSIQTITEHLFNRNIQSVIVEGGAQTLNSFILENCWDEARVFTSPTSFGDGILAPAINGDLESSEAIFEDQLRIITNNNG